MEAGKGHELQQLYTWQEEAPTADHKPGPIAWHTTQNHMARSKGLLQEAADAIKDQAWAATAREQPGNGEMQLRQPEAIRGM